MRTFRLALTVVAGLLHIPCDALNGLHVLKPQQPELVRAHVVDSHRVAYPLGPPETVLHFMFLLDDHFPHPRLWSDFFAGAQPGTHMVWAHCTNHGKCAYDVGGFNFANARLVPTVSTLPEDHLTPFVHMLKVAMKETAQLPYAGVMEKFVLIGPLTLPVKPFSSVHWTLASSSGSDICLSSPTQWAAGSVDNVPLLLPIHQPWMALNRSDAATLVTAWRSPVSGLQDWDVPLKGRWAQQNRTVPRADFHSSVTYLDPAQSAVHALLHGPVELPSQGDMRLLTELFLQRRCTTYMGFPIDAGQAKHASLLQLDPGQNFEPDAITEQLTHDWLNKLHFIPGAFLIEKLSYSSWTALRKSPFLFAGRFSDDAPLVSYSEMVLRP